MNTAETPLRLQFYDPTLYQTVISTLNTCNSDTTPFLTLDVQTSPLAPSMQNEQPQYLLDGHGEYKCILDINNNSGSIHLTSNSPCAALANCIRQIYTHLIITNNGLVIHAACVVRNNQAYIFAGKSTAGKSTVCELSHNCIIASDDLTAILKLNDRFHAWGLPAVNLTTHTHPTGPFEIKSIFTLVKSDYNHIMRLSNAKAIANILALPANLLQTTQSAKTLELVHELIHYVPVYELHFKKDPSFWKCIEESM